ncbi:MAG: phosphoglycerate mutase family protein [Bacteroidales bacterium]|nr:phosphoglycerate mutase family protein [Bacteroidales bacterium]
MDIFKISEYNQQLAWDVLEDSNIIPIWESIGAKVNIVGSLKTKLLMKNLDIDIHIYTKELSIKDSFDAISQIAQNSSFKEIQYKNLIDTEEECIEWHLIYEDKKANLWKFDIIHILMGSKYDGFVENVTDSIINKLTPETKKTILQIKYDIPDGIKIPSIEIYQAVLSNKVSSYKEFIQWRGSNSSVNTMEWLP